MRMQELPPSASTPTTALLVILSVLWGIRCLRCRKHGLRRRFSHGDDCAAVAAVHIHSCGHQLELEQTMEPLIVLFNIYSHKFSGNENLLLLRNRC